MCILSEDAAQRAVIVRQLADERALSATMKIKNNAIVKHALVLFFALLGILGIFYINYHVISSWFGKNGPANIGSIEVSYVSMGRFIGDYGFSSWAPFWYLGFPFHLFYTPIVPFLEFILHTSTRMPLWTSYRLLTGVAYIVAPISLFFLGWKLGKRWIGGLVAGLFYSVGPTVFYFLNQEVASDRFSTQFLDPRRFTVLVRWGEGPHMFSLMFLPLAALFFVHFLEHRSWRGSILWFLLSAVFLGLTALSNAIGLFASVFLLCCMLFVFVAQERGKLREALRWGVWLFVLTLGMISFWYNFSFISNFFGEGKRTGTMLFSLFPWSWLAIGLVVGAVFFGIRRFLRDFFGIAVALLWFGALFFVVYYYYASRVELLPQALRYMTEVDMGVSLLIGVTIGTLVDRLARRWSRLTVITDFLGLVCIAAAIVYVQPFLPVAQKVSGSVVDIAKTREAKIASWLIQHIDQKKGERVFVPGNYGFYLNYFSDVWQVRGGLFQAATHPWPDHIYYQLANGSDPEIARAWFTATNVKYAVITTPGSSELYRDIKNLERFQKFFKAYEEAGDNIYAIPQARPSLAKAVQLSVMERLVLPVKADDKQPLLAYAEWVEQGGNDMELTVVNHDTYAIAGTVRQGEGILVQMTYDNGWRAKDSVSGAYIHKGRDPMGFLVLYPSIGRVDILLKQA